MARYRKKSAPRRRSTSRSSNRSGYGRTSNRRTTRRSTSTRRRSGGQTIRIVLEQPGGASAANAVPANIQAAMRLLAGERSTAAKRVRPKN